LIEARIFNIGHAPTCETHEMMMTVLEYLVACRCTRMTNLSHDGDPNQGLQHAIDGSTRNLGDELPNIAENLIGGGVIDARRQNLENHPPLDGERKAVAPADLLRLFQ
jgi:hypothetical protein